MVLLNVVSMDNSVEVLINIIHKKIVEYNTDLEILRRNARHGILYPEFIKTIEQVVYTLNVILTEYSSIKLMQENNR